MYIEYEITQKMPATDWLAKGSVLSRSDHRMLPRKKIRIEHKKRVNINWIGFGEVRIGSNQTEVDWM